MDSNDTSERHWELWAERHGVDYSRIEAIHFGRPTVEVVRLVAPHLDAVNEANEKEDTEADDTSGITPFPGASRLMTAIPPRHWGIVTSGKRRTATIRLNHCGLPIPDMFITANDITRGKPDPEPYQKAIDRLGIPADQCVVIEDAPAGIRSARSAGAKVIGVTTTNPPSALNEANAIIRHLNDLQLSVVENRLQLSWDETAEY